MHPALSVIFFTVSSGIGFGFFIIVAVAGMFFQLPQQLIVEGGLIALVLVTIGLMSSTLHLANRKNAWRAIFRFRSSWLSKEGVLALIFFPIVLIYIGLGYAGYGVMSNPVWLITSVIVSLMSLAIVFSTGMIYACLKTIPQWNTSLVPANYILLGLMHGQLLILAFESARMGVFFPQIAKIALLFLTLSFIMKSIYYAWITKPAGSTVNTATGFTNATVRLLDVGHTAGNFLTDEFGYRFSAKVRTALRISVFVFGFIIPAVVIALVLNGYVHINMTLVAFISSVGGIGIERWLFFAEAKHVVNLYHD